MGYLEKCFEKDSSIVYRKIADEVILVPIRRSVGDLESIYTLNDVGARIWELIDGKKQVNWIRDIIIEEFEVSEEEAEADLIEFLQQLEGIGCIRSCSIKGRLLA